MRRRANGRCRCACCASRTIPTCGCRTTSSSVTTSPAFRSERSRSGGGNADMCGICGAFHYRGGTPDRALIERQIDVLRHRGPDDRGVWVEGPVALAHQRLSIVDLSPAGHQPMPNEDGSLMVTYNGELYGWPEMRAV